MVERLLKNILPREEWADLARDVAWEFTYVSEREVFPEAMSGSPWLPAERWACWEEPYKTTYRDYVETQASKGAALEAVRNAVGQIEDFKSLPLPWVSALKFHASIFALAEFAAVVGNLKCARFGRTPAWRTAALFGALDEIRHTEIPLTIFQQLIVWDPQFDWVHRFYHSGNWVAIAARHMVDELLLGSSAVDFAVATNFVFETGFTNLQFVGLSALARGAGDHMFEEMGKSIQTDEARHAQIGPPVLEVLVAEDKERAQYLVDKWFWRSWRLFAVVTGFAMDYLTPLAARESSFKEFMTEWVVDQFLESLASFGLERPWYWEAFLAELDHYHHLAYVSAYTYRATLWFDVPIPSPEERHWLAEKYPASWPEMEPMWNRISHCWQETDPGVDFGVHGTAIIGFCNLCQIILCGGTSRTNTACVETYYGEKRIFCSEACRWIFLREPERYAGHKDLVRRVLAGEAPGNLMAMLTQYFGLTYEGWGKDSFAGNYPWLDRRKTEANAGRST